MVVEGDRLESRRMDVVFMCTQILTWTDFAQMLKQWYLNPNEREREIFPKESF